jgi:hypothetical protein
MGEETRQSESTTRESEPQAMDEEKMIGIGLDGTKEKITTAPAPAPDASLPHARSLRSTKSHQSRAGAHGNTCFDNNGRTVVPDDPYLVKFEGDADPYNPRGMTMIRRWAIVFIVSSSSLCV